MYSCNKNSYLQGNFQKIKASLINRSIQKALDNLNIIDEHDYQPPFNRLTSEQPHIPVENVDTTRRPQGFGRWAMPKLRRELHHKNDTVVLAALTSICDLVHDPERSFEAIALRIVDRLVDLVSNELPAIRERAIQILTVIAGLGAGKEAIVANSALLDNLLDRVEDEFTAVRIHVAACLAMVSRFWTTADVLVEAGYIQVLLTNLHDETEIVEYHLETLNGLMHCDGKKIAIDEDGFPALMKLFERDEGEILSKTCQLITRLCVIPEGRKLAKEYNILPELNRLLHDERREVHTAAAEAIMFCTIKSAEKITASKIKSMPKRLVHLCKNKLNRDTQMFSIKALTSICEHPSVRKEVSTKYYKEVEAIQLSDEVPEMRQYKNTLMAMLKWVPYGKDSP